MRPCAGGLVLSYLIIGSIGDLRIPAAAAAVRTDELWRHTCFEAFVRTSPGAGYYEFNFAPSTQWAAYRFDGYRSGIRAATEISAARIKVRSSRACYGLQASLEVDQMSSLRGDGTWRLGRAAVIEDMSGHKSYWALAHPPGKADFHHSDCFALEFSCSVAT
ncbi:MAG: DOMON-like domain-containing protein [Beijerinckiaceae bacterium]